MYLAAHAEQIDKGLAEYGKTLHTFNGRNAADDCRRELVDALDYLTQLEMERDTYRAHAEAMEEALDFVYSQRDKAYNDCWDDNDKDCHCIACVASRVLHSYHEATK
jgi:hypothetical protein